VEGGVGVMLSDVLSVVEPSPFYQQHRRARMTDPAAGDGYGVFSSKSS
jgi:hypothetical protein